MARNYKTLIDLEGIAVKSGHKFRFACCDCGLVHDMVFVSADGNDIGFAVKRNPRATTMRRKRYE